MRSLCRNIMPVLLQILVVASSAGGAERVKFSKIERLSTGNLKIVTTPPEAVVLIDENRLTAKTPLAIKEITPKIRFSLKLSKDGFQPWEHDLVLAPGETKMLRVILKRPYGILKINTVPWSNVYVDGNKAGETPLLLKDLEKDKVINDLRVSLEDMKRKAEQGSMETQGEVLEQDFEAQLKAFFVHDDIAPVPKGIRGADLVQTVRSPLGAEAGILLWEIKNTKAWSSQWIPKLKDDMIEIRAALAILVSVVLPAGINRFGRIDGVWVSDPLSAVALAAVLREQLMAISRERTASMGKSEKMEALYQYLAGVEFKQKIEGIVEAFTSMQDQLNKERRAMERHWKQREKEIERVVKNTVGLYGDMQGIIGGQIPVIPALELDGESAGQLPGDDSAKG